MAETTPETTEEVKFTMNNWKSQYQNNKNDLSKAYEWLWKNVDTSKYSFWLMVYKWNDEIERLIYASNSIKGTLQRWENARKVSFGVLSVLSGGSTKLAQVGCFMFEGLEVPKEISEIGKDDYELYTWTKIDPVNNADDKALVESFFNYGDEVLYEGKQLEHTDGIKFF